MCGRAPQGRTDVGRIRNGKPAPKDGQYLDHNNVLGIWPHVSLTTRNFMHAASLGGTCWNFFTLLKIVVCSGKQGVDCRSFQQGFRETTCQFC